MVPTLISLFVRQQLAGDHDRSRLPAILGRGGYVTAGEGVLRDSHRSGEGEQLRADDGPCLRLDRHVWPPDAVEQRRPAVTTSLLRA